MPKSCRGKLKTVEPPQDFFADVSRPECRSLIFSNIMANSHFPSLMGSGFRSDVFTHDIFYCNCRPIIYNLCAFWLNFDIFLFSRLEILPLFNPLNASVAVIKKPVN